MSNCLLALCSLSASLGYGFKDRLNICSQSSSYPQRAGGKDNKDGVWPVEEVIFCYSEGFAQCHPETEGERRPGRKVYIHTQITQWYHCSIVPKRMLVCRRTILKENRICARKSNLLYQATPLISCYSWMSKITISKLRLSRWEKLPWMLFPFPPSHNCSVKGLLTW